MKKLLFILILFSQMGILLAQNPTLMVSGQVLNANNLTPISNHQVDIFISFDSVYSIQIPATVMTANDGSFTYSTPFIAQNATVYLSTTNFYGIPSTAFYTVTNSPINQVVNVNHIFYISNDTISTNCDAYFYFTQQNPDSLTVQFTDQSYTTGNGVNYNWTFGDGTASTLQNPLHTFPYSGYYQICLTIYDSICQSTFCDYIFVGNPGDTVITNDCYSVFTYNQDPSDPFNFYFQDLSTGNPNSWQWAFGDGATSTLQNPTHTYTSNGIYLVTLTISNSLTGCSSTFVNYLSIDSTWTTNCQAAFSWQPGNVPFNIGFYDFSMGNNIQTWNWTFGDGTSSTQQHPFHSYGSPGLYQVCLTITADNNCSSTWCEFVQVDSFNFCNNYFTYQTSGNDVLFNGFHTGAPAIYYEWHFGDGTSATGQQVTHNYAAPGTYYVTLVSSDTVGCTAISDQIIVVNGGGFNQIYGQVFGGNFPVLQGYVLLFSDDTNPAQTSYFDVTVIDSMGVYVFSQVPNGDYYILAVPFNVNGYLPTYYGNEIDWANATLITLPQANNPYNINLVPSSGSQGNGPCTINGIVNGTPAMRNVINNMKILLFDENQNPITYSGIEGNTFSFSSLGYQTFYINPQLPGYESEMTQIVLSEENPNVVVTLTIEGTEVVLDVKENETQLSIHGIYPNPAEHNINVSLYSNDAQNGTLKIFDATGKLVSENTQTLSQGENILSMDVTNLSNGVYLIQMTTAKGQISSHKFLKK